jgi:transcriptional regulator with XRE-family HTH domain
MATIENRIRDIRESKNMSQTDAANACGLSFARYERIENGSPRTTDDEIKQVTAALRKCKKLEKKLAGRPFKDPTKQRAVEEARKSGQSVAEIIVTSSVASTPAPAKAAPAPAKKAAAKKPRASRAKKEATASVAADAEAVRAGVLGTESELSALL